MKLNLTRETLLKSLQLVIGVVERKRTLPILSNVLLSIEINQLSITGTDLEVELIGQTKLGKNIIETSYLTLPGRKLVDICRALPENASIELHLDLDKGKVILRSGRSRFMLSTLPAGDFPAVERRDSQLELLIPQADFRRLLQRTNFSMAQQDVRYYLNGLLLEIYSNKLRAIATDGHRLAANNLYIQTKTEHRLQIIIPRKGILELLRLLSEGRESAIIRIGSNYISVSTNDFILTSKLIEGRFPDCERVIPKSGSKRFAIDRDTLKQALSRMAILCNEKFKGVRFELRQGLLRILANNPEQETAEEEININYTAEDLDIGFNINYLIGILNVVNPGNILLTFSTADGSVLINEAESESGSAFVVMPMRL